MNTITRVIKSFFPLLIMQMTFAFGFFPEKVDMLELLKECPVWMERRINSDLIFFQNLQLSKSKLDEMFNEMTGVENVVKFTLSNNHVTSTKHFDSDPNVDTRIGAYIDAITYLCSITEMPDLTFYMMIHDGFLHEEPHFNFHLDEAAKFPLLVMSKEAILTKSKSIMVPDFEALRGQYQVLPGEDVCTYSIPWEQKTSKLIWRGCYGQCALDSSTNIVQCDNTHLFSRITLCELSNQYPDLIDARFTTYCLDIPQIQNLHGDWISYQELFTYKYQILIHGNAASYGRSGWRFFSNSLVFKPESPWTQWYYEELLPYVHYIPVEANLEDLVEKILWAKENDSLAKEIAANAREFALTKLKVSDHLTYLYFLLVKYSQLDFVD